MTTASIGSALADAQLANQDLQSRTPGIVAWLHFGDLHITNRDEQNYRDFRDLIAHANRCLQGTVDFAVLPGDNAEDGTEEQYRLVREALDELSLPWHAITGDHDFKTCGLQLFRKYLRSNTHYSFDLDRYHFIFLNALGTGKHGSFELGSDQMTWLSADLHDATRKSRASVLFLHCYPSELSDAEPCLAELLQQHDVLAVDMGHTHYNEIANDGRVIYAATRSTGQIEEGPVGFSISVLDRGVVSWKFKPLGVGERPPSAATEINWEDFAGPANTSEAKEFFEPNLYIYDAYPGGIGFSEPLYSACDTLLNRTLELITACPCENRCPSCVGPTADRSERTKEVAIEILGRLCGDTQFLVTQTEETT